jgi:hypothetical protein
LLQHAVRRSSQITQLFGPLSESIRSVLQIVRLLAPGSAAQAGAIVSPTASGVILIRRLAPDAESFAAAAAASAQDICRAEP